MKFAIMARMLRHRGMGAYRFIDGLLSAFSEHPSENEIFVLVDPELEAETSARYPMLIVKGIGPSTKTSIGRFVWDHFEVGRWCRRNRIDALLAPGHVRPLYTACPCAVIIFDMMYHLLPGTWSWSEQFYMRNAVSLLTTRASRIVAISENTRSDVMRVLKVPFSQTEVIYPACDKHFRPLDASETNSIRAKYDLKREFVLYVGGYHPRKNVSTLIRAFSAILSSTTCDLVLVGPLAFDWKQCRRLIKELPDETRVKAVGMIPDADLPALYNQALAFCYPSSYEGFGLPVVEAMSCGTPVITACVSSIPEVSGDAIIAINPADSNSITEALLRVIDDPTLRAALRASGMKQSERFSWNESAKRFERLLTDISVAR